MHIPDKQDLLLSWQWGHCHFQIVSVPIANPSVSLWRCDDVGWAKCWDSEFPTRETVFLPRERDLHKATHCPQAKGTNGETGWMQSPWVSIDTEAVGAPLRPLLLPLLSWPHEPTVPWTPRKWRVACLWQPGAMYTPTAPLKAERGFRFLLGYRRLQGDITPILTYENRPDKPPNHSFF